MAFGHDLRMLAPETQVMSFIRKRFRFNDGDLKCSLIFLKYGVPNRNYYFLK